MDTPPVQDFKAGRTNNMAHRVPDSLCSLEQLPQWTNFGRERVVYLTEEGGEITAQQALKALQEELPVYYRTERVKE